MRIETLTVPGVNAILLDEVKDHMRIDGTDEDASLGALVGTATSLVEGYLDLALIDRQVALYLDAWPTTSGKKANEPWWNGVADGAISTLDSSCYHVPLMIKPVHIISGIDITTADGSTVAWGTDNYYLKPGMAPALVRKYGRSWPVPGVRADGIKITATAGFGADWNTVPASIRQALLMLVAHLYYNRGNEAGGNAFLASGAAPLLASFRDMRI
ncbi:MAG: phage head-tail connector protein [Kordiimonadaceae bacterium]|nr:phage head-tail connector protein [Kordiimonadaceae bacterium]